MSYSAHTKMKFVNVPNRIIGKAPKELLKLIISTSDNDVVLSHLCVGFGCDREKERKREREKERDTNCRKPPSRRSSKVMLS